MLCCLNILLNLLYLVISLIGIVARNANELKFGQTLNILHCNLTAQAFLERLQTLIHRLISLLASSATLDELIQLILDEDTLQRRCVPSLIQLAELNLKLQAEQRTCMVGRTAQNLLHAHKARLLVDNYARVWRDRYLARGEGVECIDGLVRRLIISHVDNNLHLVGRQVINLLNLNLTLLVGLDNRILNRLRSR